METTIDDIATDGGVSDIQGEPVQTGGTANRSKEVKMSGTSMRPSDVTVYHMTLLGHILSVAGLPAKQEGVHYVKVGIIPYRPTPENFESKEEEIRPHESRNGVRKMYKQTPLRLKH